MDVDQLLMVVSVGMWPVLWDSRGVPVLVVVIMPVQLRMLCALVAVFVHMAFSQVQPDPRAHEESCGREAEGRCLSAGRQGHQHTHKGC